MEGLGFKTQTAGLLLFLRFVIYNKIAVLSKIYSRVLSYDLIVITRNIIVIPGPKARRDFCRLLNAACVLSS